MSLGTQLTEPRGWGCQGNSRCSVNPILHPPCAQLHSGVCKHSLNSSPALWSFSGFHRRLGSASYTGTHRHAASVSLVTSTQGTTQQAHLRWEWTSRGGFSGQLQFTIISPNPGFVELSHWFKPVFLKRHRRLKTLIKPYKSEGRNWAPGLRFPKGVHWLRLLC